MLNKKVYIISCIVLFVLLFYFFIQRPESDVFLPTIDNSAWQYYDAVDNNIIDLLLSISRLSLDRRERDADNNIFIRTYFDSGAMHIEAEVRNSMLNGHAKIFYENGSTMIETEFHEGQLHGSAIFYDEAGELLRDYTFYNGQLYGISREYYPNGMVWKDKTFLDGKLTGFMNIYHFEDGHILLSAHYLDNYRHGETVGYDENKTVIYREIFEHGLRVMRILYDHQGNVIK